MLDTFLADWCDLTIVSHSRCTSSAILRCQCIYDQLATLDRQTQVTRCFSASQLLVFYAYIMLFYYHRCWRLMHCVLEYNMQTTLYLPDFNTEAENRVPQPDFPSKFTYFKDRKRWRPPFWNMLNGNNSDIERICAKFHTETSYQVSKLAFP